MYCVVIFLISVCRCHSLSTVSFLVKEMIGTSVFVSNYVHSRDNNCAKQYLGFIQKVITSIVRWVSEKMVRSRFFDIKTLGIRLLKYYSL